MDKYKEITPVRRKENGDATELENSHSVASLTGAVVSEGDPVSASSSNGDRIGVVDGLRTDDGSSEDEVGNKKRKRKGGKGKIKAKAKAKGRHSAEASNSALLPQKKQGKKGGKIKWAIG